MSQRGPHSGRLRFGSPRLICATAVAVLILACQSGGDPGEPAAREDAMHSWWLMLETSGGITGRGQGSVEVRSSGTTEVTTAGGERCPSVVEGLLLERLEEAISSAEPRNWKRAYVDERGADMFTYQLTIETAEEERHEVEWNDGGSVPEDLREIWASINAVRNQIECGGTSGRSGSGRAPVS